MAYRNNWNDAPSRPNIPDGQVNIECPANGKCLVEIGRSNYTKRFQLIGNEGPALLAALKAEFDK